MRPENLIIVIAGCLSVIVPFYLYSRNRKVASNRVFALLSIVTGPLWAISIAMFREAETEDSAMLWGKVIYLVAVLIGILFHLFTKKFPRSRKGSIFTDILVYVVGGIILYSILFTSSFVVSVNLNSVGNAVTLGYMYIVWLVWMLAIFAFGGVGILKVYSRLGDVEKHQLKYFMIGIFVPMIGVVPTNALLPLFGIYQYIWIGPLFMVLMNLILAYGISRTRFGGDDVLKEFAAKTVVLAGILYALFFGIGRYFTLAFGDLFHRSSYLAGIFIALIVSLLLAFLLKWLDTFIGLVINKGYDQVKVRDSFVSQTAVELKMDKIATVLLSTIYSSLHVEKSAVIIFAGDSSEPLFSRFKSIRLEDIEDLYDIVCLWDESTMKDEALVLYELEYILEHQVGGLTSKESARLSQIIKFMKANDIRIAIRLSKRLHLNGLVLVGSKKGRDKIKSEDVKLLELLSNNASVAFGRALLYDEVESFAETLQEKVDEQTEELQKKIDELEEVRRKERDMIDIMGHELRTPLSIAQSSIGLMKMMQKKSALTEENLKTYIDRADESIKREIDIVEKMLRATKLEKGTMLLSKEKVDVIDVIEDGVEGQKKLAKDKDLYLKFNKPDSWKSYPSAYADRTRIQEIVDNLLNNAVKYTEKGGVTVDIEHDDDFITVHIKDTGVGIPKEDIPNLGKRFFRSQQYLSKSGDEDIDVVRPGGTGLGLYVTFGLVRTQDGKIWVDSEVGKGSTFHFTVPIYKQQEESQPVQKPKEVDMFKRLGLKKE